MWENETGKNTGTILQKAEKVTDGTMSLLVKQKHFLIVLRYCSEERKTAVRFYYKCIIPKTKNMFKAQCWKMKSRYAGKICEII